MKHKRAFTLIELLVVIAIIAILAAILFPVFAQAKVAAKKANSISNAKQVALACLMYTNDYDDTFSWAQPGGWEWPQTWLVNVQPYIKTFQIYVSPVDSEPRPEWSGPPFSYPGNGMTCWGNGWEFHGVMNARQNWWTNWQDSVTTTSVGLSAQTILTGERHSVRPYMDRDIRGAWDLNDVIFYGWWGDLPGQGPAGGDLWGPPTTKFGSVAAKYANNATFSFVDGHAAAMNPMRTINGAASSNMRCDANFHKMWDAKRTE